MKGRLNLGTHIVPKFKPLREHTPTRPTGDRGKLGKGKQGGSYAPRGNQRTGCEVHYPPQYGTYNQQTYRSPARARGPVDYTGNYRGPPKPHVVPHVPAYNK